MPSVPFSTITSPGTVLRNDITGRYGGRFGGTSGENVTVTHLGRWVHAGNTGTCRLTIVSAFDVLLGEVTIDLGAETPGAFAWGELDTPVVIPASAPYFFILMDLTAGGPLWANGFGGQSNTQEDIGILETGIYNAGIGSLQNTGGISLSHGPVSFQYSTPVKTWTKSGTTYTTDGTPYQISSSIFDADAGDTILIPAGTYTWGAGGAGLSINKAVTVAGAGQASTIINMDPAATIGGFTKTMIALTSGTVVRDMTFIGGDGTPKPRASLFGVGAVSGWRITNITFTQRSGQAGYFLYGQYCSNGLIDNCTITGGAGTSELIFTRGRPDSWTTPHSFGGEDNIFIEDCVFNGGGYVNDANSNARHVVRNCTINGAIKVDGHGLASNGGPARGVRHMEVYRNTWTYGPVFNAAAMELRGGGIRVWGNKTINAVGFGSSKSAYLFLTDYGATAIWPNFGSQYQTPADYPLQDQIGVGMDPKAAASEPAYLWDNLAAATDSAGSATIDWTLSWKAIPQGAIDRYRAQTGNPSATFTMQDVIAADRDYFKHTQGASFDGTSGVGIGTKAEMLAITPSKTGVGFWVTDEGSWDTTLPAGTSGQLYVWNGAEWMLDYVPYTYPHPKRGVQSAPVVTVSSGNQTVDAFTTVTMTVTAAANPAPTYQWRKDEVPLPGATSSTLTLLTVTEESEGVYDCVVTNNLGAVASPPATLTVNPVVDTTPPSPNPATFASITVVSSRQITVVATTATDTESSPVQYNFAVNDVWTGWQSSPLRYFTELTPSTEYTFLCKSRDAILNEGQQSAPSTATTNAPEPTSPANVLGNRGTRARRLGIF